MTTFAPLFVPDEIAAAVSDRAWLAAMLDAERALVRAEASAGVVPADVAGAIAGRCDPELYDAGALARAGRAAGNPAEPLVRAMREGLGAEAAGFAHWGATSQDILDTAAMLVAKRALRPIGAWLGEAAGECASLARAHRTTPIAGRTLLQQATPTTFGLKAAGWLLGLREAGALVEAVSARRLRAQLGGAVGSLAALGARGPEVARLYARELELAEPLAPWHTERSPLIELGAALATAAAACAKISGDVILLAQTEVAEVREGAGGASSTMPHKRNPAVSVRTLACAAGARRHAAALVAGEPHEHERAAGAWQAEWPAITGALEGAGGAAAGARELLAELEVDPARMRRNLDLTGGLVMAERVAYAAAGRVGLIEARRLVAAAAERSQEDVTFRQALAESEGLGLTPDELDAALDPAAGLESAAALVDRVLDGGESG
ncbi:MAG TPA: lyase family protein [Gaiellales bacterium]|nr:lyase family protein [Gaiellales bacterium]